MEKKEWTLRELIYEYSANGVWVDDAGNGSAGIDFVHSDDEWLQGYMDTELTKNPKAQKLDVGESKMETYEYESDWIEIDDPKSEYISDNPYRVKFYF
jgi:hypothetical protein